ncbi:unnamed protein product, partial [Choristocarpus tenellus]
IRLVEGRDKPIDRLAKNVLLFGDQSAEEIGIKFEEKGDVDISGLEMELREPYQLFNGLNLEDLEQLEVEIAGYLDLVGEDGPNRDFWSALAVVCESKLTKAREREGDGDGGVATGGVHKTVLGDVVAKFEDKSLEELKGQETKIKDMLEIGEGGGVGGGGEGVDSEFWEAVLKELHVYQAVAKLREVHQRMLETQLERLEGMRDKMKSKRVAKADGEGEGEEEVGEDAGVKGDGGAAADSSEQALGMLAHEARKGMGAMEEGMDLADEVDIGGKTYWWHDKFRPRKPRYFNRVKTGYDWNKYNQTHYDHDNPPPKTVQ